MQKSHFIRRIDNLGCYVMIILLETFKILINKKQYLTVVTTVLIIAIVLSDS